VSSHASRPVTPSRRNARSRPPRLGRRERVVPDRVDGGGDAAVAPTRVATIAATSQPRVFRAEPGAPLLTDVHPAQLAQLVRSCVSGGLWVDIDTTNRHQVALLEKVFDFHPLSVEDALNPQSRVKLDEYRNSLVAIVRGIRFIGETADPYDIETYNLTFFIGRNILVTAHAGPSASVDAIVERLIAAPDLLENGIEKITHGLMDVTIDAWFPVLDRVDEFVDSLEERVYETFDQDVMRDVFAVKRLILAMRRHLTPQREVFNVLTNRPTPFLSAASQVWFRDIYDHVLRIADSVEQTRDLLGNVMDSYLSQVSNRLGQVTKGLSVIATLSVPFVVVSGMWGMNFAHMPLANSPHGFWIMLVLQLGLGAVLVYLLRKWALL
jgi:magnesium transporter